MTEEIIMIVDDVPENLRVLKSMLQGQGYSTRTLPSGDLALEAIKNEIPDIILLDINMPGKNGYDICKELQQDEVYREIPVIFISALTDVKEKVKGLEVGGVDYITKPFQIEEVQARVETHIKLKRANKKLQQTLSELKETQNQLVHSEKMASLGLLASGMAHEINNPLNSIIGNSQVLGTAVTEIKNLWNIINNNNLDKESFNKQLTQLKEEYSYDELFESSEKIVNTIQEASKRAVKIIKGLREFIHEGKSEIQLVDVNHCVESTLSIINYLFNDNIKLTKKLNNLPLIPTDEGKVNQVLLNLLTNAIDAIGERNFGEIEIISDKCTIDNKPFVIVSVKDNGCGINQEKQKKIFDPFFTTKDIGKGTGLGLSISLGLIKGLNGNITCESVETEGSKFSIYLPIVEMDTLLNNE